MRQKFLFYFSWDENSSQFSIRFEDASFPESPHNLVICLAVFLCCLAISQDYGCPANSLKSQEPELSTAVVFRFRQFQFRGIPNTRAEGLQFLCASRVRVQFVTVSTVRCNVKSVENAHSTGESLSNSKLTSLLFQIVVREFIVTHIKIIELCKGHVNIFIF